MHQNILQILVFITCSNWHHRSPNFSFHTSLVQGKIQKEINKQSLSAVPYIPYQTGTYIPYPNLAIFGKAQFLAIFR